MKKATAIQVGLLIANQWINTGIIIHCALVLNGMHNTSEMSITSPYLRTKLLLIMGCVSLVGATLLLGSRLCSFMRSNAHCFLVPLMLWADAFFALIFVMLWGISSSLVLNVSPSCLDDQIAAQVCSFFDQVIILAYLSIGVWLMTLAVALLAIVQPQGRPALPPTISSRLYRALSDTSLNTHMTQAPLSELAGTNTVVPISTPLQTVSPLSRSVLFSEGSHYSQDTKHHSTIQVPQAPYIRNSAMLPTIEKGIGNFDVHFYSTPSDTNR